MNKKLKSEILFCDPQPGHRAGVGRMEFYPVSQGIYVDLTSKGDECDGLSAGSEGLGCRFFSAASDRLCAMYLEMLPFEVVDRAPMELLAKVKDTVAAKVRPAQLKVASFPQSPINPDAVWLLEPFGSVIFSFDNIVIEPHARFLEQSSSMVFFSIAEGLVVGLEGKTLALGMIMLTGFEKIQTFFDVTVSNEKHGKEFMQIVNSIHGKFLEDPEPTYFKNFCDEISAKLDALFKTPDKKPKDAYRAVGQLMEFYRSQINYLQSL